ncbi:hypothetical protein EDB89DRAFT_2168783 [Lactarius sanguifluus]|nr:hypothetical protein EDB89DRAFT_2168783 [Lactarius sanguifluus]
MRYHWLYVLAFLTATPLADFAKPLAPWGDVRVKHAWSSIPANWETLGCPSAGTTIDLYIALNSRHDNALIDALYEVSDPKHPRHIHLTAAPLARSFTYGAHLSKEQVAELVRPHPETLEFVTSWLAHHGVRPSSISMTHGGAWLTVSNVLVSRANEMLGASYQLYRHAKVNDTIIRTVSYALPEVLHAHIQAVAPTTYFASIRTQRRTPPRRSVKAAAALAETEATSGKPVTVLSSRTTSSQLRGLYKTFAYVPAAADRNTLGIYGYQRQYPSQTDLAMYMSNFRADVLPPTLATFTVELVNGGEYDPNNPGKEANLNVQYASAMVYPTPIIFYSIGGWMEVSDSGEPLPGDVELETLGYLFRKADIPQTISVSYSDYEHQQNDTSLTQLISSLRFSRFVTKPSAILSDHQASQLSSSRWYYPGGGSGGVVVVAAGVIQRAHRRWQSCVVIAVLADVVRSRIRVSSKWKGFRAGIRKRNKKEEPKSGAFALVRASANANGRRRERVRTRSRLPNFWDSHAEKEGEKLGQPSAGEEYGGGNETERGWRRSGRRRDGKGQREADDNWHKDKRDGVAEVIDESEASKRWAICEAVGVGDVKRARGAAKYDHISQAGVESDQDCLEDIPKPDQRVPMHPTFDCILSPSSPVTLSDQPEPFNSRFVIPSPPQTALGHHTVPLSCNVGGDDATPTVKTTMAIPCLNTLAGVVKLLITQISEKLSECRVADEKNVPEEYARVVCILYAQLGARGVTVLYPSGNDGVGKDCEEEDGSVWFVPEFPASCPYLTAVGGTTDFAPEVAAPISGGGFSEHFLRPVYQDAAVSAFLERQGTQYAGHYNPAGRGIPDIAAQALDFPIYFRNARVNEGGTSCSVPLTINAQVVAGVISLLNDYLITNGRSPLGFLNIRLYGDGVAGLNDITSGSNPGCGTNGFSAVPGWDPVTGHGTPDFQRLQNIFMTPLGGAAGQGNQPKIRGAW